MNNDAVIAHLRDMLPDGVEIELPPPIVKELGLEFVEYLPGEAVMARCPAAHKLTGPMGVVQGGVVGVALDAAYGTLAYLEMKQPCITITMDLSFVRPLLGDGQDFHVRVSILDQTRNFILMDGHATNHQGKTVARSTTTMKLMA